MKLKILILAAILSAWSYTSVFSQEDSNASLTQQLLSEPIDELAGDVTRLGDPARGATAFHLPTMNCAKCHIGERRLGPNLTKKREASIKHLIESVLQPSAKIHEGFETVRIAHEDGRMITGILVGETKDALTVESIEQSSPLKIPKTEIEDWARSKTSSMPTDLANQLSNRQQFLDLVSYLSAIVGNPELETKLQPVAAVIAPLPEYESRVDHAGIIRDLNQESFERGEEIYRLRCASCHGTTEEEGSMPTSLRFASGTFRHGNDPFTIYQTLTHGYGMMNPQRWMVPQQKYAVVHYIREHFLKANNESQLFEITDEYLASLPEGNTRGPKPILPKPWTQMDYGPSMFNTIEVGRDGSNIAQKGITVRLDSGPGGVESGSHWMLYEHDTMRVAAAWSGKFINWEGIHFNGVHGRHPRVSGEVHLSNPTGPGYARPGAEHNERFVDDRVVGRDGKHYGPLPDGWAKYLGMYRFGNQSILKYRIGETEVHETPGLAFVDEQPVYLRYLNIGKRANDLCIQVANTDPQLSTTAADRTTMIVARDDKPGDGDSTETTSHDELRFDGSRFAEIEAGERFDMHSSDFSIFARIKTDQDGTLFAKTRNQDEWLSQGKTFFLRGGRPTFDIGWVGAVRANQRVDDGKWHDVVMTWKASDGVVRFFVDGKEAGEDELAPKRELKDSVVRIGFTNGNFPAAPFFKGAMKGLRFYQRILTAKEISNPDEIDLQKLVGHWKSQAGAEFPESGGDKSLTAKISGGSKSSAPEPTGLMLGTSLEDAIWGRTEEGNLNLTIPAGDAVNLVISSCPVSSVAQGMAIKKSLPKLQTPRDLQAMTQGGPPNYSQKLTSRIIRGEDSGPFAVDVFERPTANPWNCQLRLTGLDFLPGGDVAIVSAWDGSVWRINGFTDSKSETLSWQRIAAGLFQPLGVKCVEEKIYVICRDQIVRLHDLNGDFEADWYENFNSDHQVTEHFHEFAMGLQTDEEGNFYYAKSARHAKKAVVPHHGTLLKVSPDGKHTEIIANGFRAANGVCINGDGSFVVTDQEGHWNPKNRINWVRPGQFYGNMFGYHDVTDDADSAMEDPLCWITNEFDRSPGELLWVDSDKWGPLKGSLLNLSYGYGKVYVVPHEFVNGKVQGGMCEFPIEQFPTGVMRGRFHPTDGQLYCCGMFAWAGSQHQPGGLYRVRYTEKPVHLPIGLSATSKGVQIQFSGKLDQSSATDAGNYSVNVWNLKRTKNYGSKHYDERPLEISAARLLEDGKSVELSIPDLEPTWGMEINYELQKEGGKPFTGKIHNSIFKLAE